MSTFVASFLAMVLSIFGARWKAYFSVRMLHFFQFLAAMALFYLLDVLNFITS